MYWLIFCDLEESTKLKKYLTFNFSIKIVVEPKNSLSLISNTFLIKPLRLKESLKGLATA
jgi:hypothetical protein